MSRAAVVLVLMIAAQARAVEPAHAKIALVVRAQPKQEAPIVGRFAENQDLTLLGTSSDGQWVHVKGQRHAGWAPRNLIAGAENAPPSRDTLAEAKNPRPDAWLEPNGSARELRFINRDRVALRSRPSEDAQVVGNAGRGERVTLVRLSTNRRWALIDMGSGEVAWLPASALAASGSTAASTSKPANGAASEPAPSEARPAELSLWSAPAESATESSTARAGSVATLSRVLPPTRATAFSVGAAGGIAFLARRQGSTNPAAMSKYEFNATAAAASVGLEYSHLFKRRARLGVEVGYGWAGAAGVRAHAADGSDVVFPLDTHTISGALSVGVHSEVAGGVDLSLKVGAIGVLTVLGAQGAMALPSDRVIGMTAGLQLSLPRVTEIHGHPLSFGLSADAIAPATRSDNAGLSAKGEATYGARFGGGFGLELVRRRAGAAWLAVAYGYQLLVTNYPTGAPAVGLGSSQHLVTAGFGYAL